LQEGEKKGRDGKQSLYDSTFSLSSPTRQRWEGGKKKKNHTASVHEKRGGEKKRRMSFLTSI